MASLGLMAATSGNVLRVNAHAMHTMKGFVKTIFAVMDELLKSITCKTYMPRVCKQELVYAAEGEARLFLTIKDFSGISGWQQSSTCFFFFQLHKRCR